MKNMKIIFFELYPHHAKEKHVYLTFIFDDLARFPYVNWQSAKTICFSDTIFWPCVWSLCFLTFAIKAEGK